MADDDDDWTGTPPEGRHTREQSDPGYWARQWKGSAITGGAIAILLIIVLILVLI